MSDEIYEDDYIRVLNAQGIFIVLNKEKAIYSCTECIVVSDEPGYVKNEDHCEHAKKYLEWLEKNPPTVYDGDVYV